MSLFSSILGGQGATPIGNPQQITTTEIPTQLAPYYTDILGKAQALYNKRVEEGYKPYEGPTIAQYTPEQEATFAGIAGLQGQVAPKFAEAEQMTRDAAGAITGEQLQEAMSPYQQAVTDIEKRESQKSFEQNVLPKLRAAQVAQGSFGGTRGTLLEAQALGEQQRTLGDIQAKGSAAAFKDARAALDAQRLRQGQGATQLANLAPAALSNQLKELGAQQTVGETKQRQAQTALDEAYRQFQLEKQEPYDAMSKYQSVVTGAPLGSTQYAPPAAPPPSLGQTLLGGATTAAGLYGAFTGNNPLAAVGLMGKKEGGGLSDLPVIKRAESGRLSRNFKAANQQGVLGVIGDIYNQYNPFSVDRRYDIMVDAKRRGQREDELGMGMASRRKEPIKFDTSRRDELRAAMNNNDISNPYMQGVNLIEPNYESKNFQLSSRANLVRRKNESPEDYKKRLENINNKEKGLSSLYKKPIGPKPDEKIVKNKKSVVNKESVVNNKNNDVVNNTLKPTGQLSDYEKNIRDSEDAYLKMIVGADKRFTDRAAAAEKQGAKDKYMAVAQLGLDIMQAPSKGNLFSTVATSAKNSKVLEKVQAANQRLQKQRDDLEDKAFAAKTGLAKEELGVALNREDRNSIKEAKDAEKKYKSDTLKIAKDELQIKKDELEILKTQSNLETSDYAFIDKQTKSLLDGEYAIGEDGQRKYIGKKGLDPIFQAELDQIEIDAQQALVAAGSVAAYTKTYLPLIKERIESVYQRGTDKAKSNSGNKTVKQELKKNQ
jgi:hypothetical protein